MGTNFLEIQLSDIWYDAEIMAKNNGKKRATVSRHTREEDAQQTPRISSGTVRSVWAVLLLATSLFLVLAAFNVGGAVGSLIYRSLTYLVGIGYILLPVSLTLTAMMLFRPMDKRFGALNVASVLIFLLSGLGLIALASVERGGVVGGAVARIFVAAVDVPATILFLSAFMIVGLFIAFDVHMGDVIARARERARARREASAIAQNNDVVVSGLSGSEESEDEQPHEETGTYEDETVSETGDSEHAAVDHEPVVNNQTDGRPGDDMPVLAAFGRTYVPPPVSLLGKNKGKPEVGDVKANMNIIKRTLQNFGIQVEMDEVSIGPTVTRYAMKPAEDVRISRIVALQSNLELALAASPVRIEAPIPGKSLVGIEVPNISRTTLGLAPLLSDPAFTESDKPLLVALGRSITGTPHYADLARMPHMLVAGATGAGKSVTIHDFVVSLLYRCGPDRLRFVMIDPKRVELTAYNSIPHLLTPVITDAKKAIISLKWLAKEMERRYNVLEAERVRDIASYHTNVLGKALAKDREEGVSLPEPMPYIVVVIDELADIMTTYPRELETGIVRLAQMSRAVGIHLILSTQRPSVKVITGLIKANVPARVALQVASQIDSRTILDMGGAEKLLGAGDMLFLSGEMNKPRRVQAPYISENELKSVVKFIARENGESEGAAIDFSDNKMSDSIFSSAIGSDTEGDDDELYEEAYQAVLQAGKASTSYLQRKLRIGYARAARLMDILEERGIIGPQDGAKPRDVIGAGNADELVRKSNNQHDVADFDENV